MVFKTSKKWGTKELGCPNCKGTGKRLFCGKCGSQIYRYEDGIPLCQRCAMFLTGKEVRW